MSTVETEREWADRVGPAKPTPGPQHSALSAKTRELIRREFGGDYQEAEYVAEKIQARSTRYPEWVMEVAGAKGGWRDPMGWAIRR